MSIYCDDHQAQELVLLGLCRRQEGEFVTPQRTPLNVARSIFQVIKSESALLNPTDTPVALEQSG